MVNIQFRLIPQKILRWNSETFSANIHFSVTSFHCKYYQSEKFYQFVISNFQRNKRTRYAEAATGGVLKEVVFLEISIKSQENTSLFYTANLGGAGVILLPLVGFPLITQKL